MMRPNTASTKIITTNKAGNKYLSRGTDSNISGSSSSSLEVLFTSTGNFVGG